MQQYIYNRTGVYSSHTDIKRCAERQNINRSPVDVVVKAVSMVQMCVSAAEGPSCMKCTHSLLWKAPVGTKERGERKDGGILRESMMTARQVTHTHTQTHGYTSRPTNTALT